MIQLLQMEEKHCRRLKYITTMNKYILVDILSDSLWHVEPEFTITYDTVPCSDTTAL